MCSHHWWSPKPWEEFSFSRDSCQTPLNSPPLRRLKFFTWDICISLIFLLNCHVELFRKPHHDNHIDSYFECTRQKQSFLEQVFGYLWQRWNFKGNFELSININAGLCVLTIPQEKSSSHLFRAGRESESEYIYHPLEATYTSKTSYFNWCRICPCPSFKETSWCLSQISSWEMSHFQFVNRVVLTQPEQTSQNIWKKTTFRQMLIYFKCLHHKNCKELIFQTKMITKITKKRSIKNIHLDWRWKIAN